MDSPTHAGHTRKPRVLMQTLLDFLHHDPGERGFQVLCLAQEQPVNLTGTTYWLFATKPPYLKVVSLSATSGAVGSEFFSPLHKIFLTFFLIE